MGINGKYMFASHAILDGEATLSCPKFPAVGAAVDALVHTVEGYICNTSNEFSDFLAEKSFYYLINSISDLNNEVGNAEKRLNLLKGAYLAGIVQMNAGGGISSAISYPLSVYYKVPHGIGGGIMLLEMARYNIEKGYTPVQIENLTGGNHRLVLFKRQFKHVSKIVQIQPDSVLTINEILEEK